MPRIVFDAGVLVGAAIFPMSVPRFALDRARMAGSTLASDATFDEIDDVLRRKKFDRYVPINERIAFLNEYLREVEIVPVLSTIQACRDPNDDMYLELAVDGNATHIISSDADLLALHPFRGIAIQSPQAFLTALTSSTRP